MKKKFSDELAALLTGQEPFNTPPPPTPPGGIFGKDLGEVTQATSSKWPPLPDEAQTTPKTPEPPKEVVRDMTPLEVRYQWHANHQKGAYEFSDLVTDANFLVALADDSGKKDELLKAIIPPPPEPEYDSNVDISTIKHKQFDDLFLWLTTRLSSGIFQPVWLWGNPGGGKSHVAEQLSERLREWSISEGILGDDAPENFFYPMYCSSLTTESKAIGFRSAAAGAYIAGCARQAYEHGGLFYLDEIDNANPDFLVNINAFLSNKTFMFPDGALVKRHPAFFVMAGANTLGQGSVNGFKRQVQDAASRDRYAKVYFEYDERLEFALAQHDRWTKYVRGVREYLSGLARNTVHITPRASYGGAAALRRGLKPAAVVDAFLFSELSKDVRASVISNCGTFNG